MPEMGRSAGEAGARDEVQDPPKENGRLPIGEPAVPPTKSA